MDKRVVNEIDNLLLKKWDPIGIQNIPEAKDEYSQYAIDLYKIIQSSGSCESLFEYLWEVETQNMGLKGNKARTKEFAEFVFYEIQKLINKKKKDS